MNPRNAVSVNGALGLCFLLMFAAPLLGQAIFTVSASSTIGADVGVAELTGEIFLSVASGTTAAAPLFIQYSAPITNNSAAEISVVGSGGLNGFVGPVTFDRANRTIRIDVPAGGTFGDGIGISGVRVELAGQGLTRAGEGLTSVSARVTAPAANGNSIVAGQDVVTVISSVEQPYTISFDADSIKLTNLMPASATSTILIEEGYPAAFSSAVGSFGQTVPTQIRLNPFPLIPRGVKITFAATATSSETGALLTTASGLDETVPRADGSTSVIYHFTAAPNSNTSVESFQIGITVTVTPPADTGTIQFQATLVPIGVAIPYFESPSTDIPRYVERPLPDETDLQTGQVRLAFPLPAQPGEFTGIALTNPIPFRVKVSLAAYDAAGKLISGTGITNPVNLIMPRSGQFAKLATEIFGPGFNASVPGSIVATGNTSVLTGFYLEGATNSISGLDGATADLAPARTWVWPSVFHQGPEPYTMLRIFNPGSQEATAVLKLYDAMGSLKANATVMVPAGGTRIEDARSVFSSVGVDSIDGGYVIGSSDTGLVVSERFGNDNDSNVLQGQAAIQRNAYLLPHFVTGGGYSTELSLTNMDAASIGKVTLTALDDAGAPTGGDPVSVSIPPGSQYTRTIGQIFPALGGAFASGYIRVDVTPSFQGPFSTVTPIIGFVRFTSASGIGSTALPILLPPSADFVYSHVAQNQGYFTGVAMVNQNQGETAVRLEVFTEEGTSVGSAAITLKPGQKVAKLVQELVPASAGQVGGYVRVQSTLPITSFSLFGTGDGNLLSAIPPQSAGQ